jgi:cyanophycin synthetase
MVVPAAMARAVSTVLPPLSGTVPDFGGWRRVTTSVEPVPVAAVVEVLAIAVQRYVGWPVRFCSWQPAEEQADPASEAGIQPAGPDRDPARAVFEIATPTTGLAAAKMALALASALIDGNGPEELQAMLLQHMSELGR